MTKIKNFKEKLFSLVLALYAAMLIADPYLTSESIKQSLLRCANVIIPSLFAFMAVSALIVRSGAYIYLSAPFLPLAKILAIPKELFFVFLTANTAGYPIGASIISTLVDSNEIDKKSAARLLCCCYNGGPAFFVSALGIAAFGSARAGMMVFCSILLANLTIAVFLNRIFPIKCNASQKSVSLSARQFTESVDGAGVSMLKICGMIIFFSTIVSFFSKLFKTQSNYTALLTSVLEISNLSTLSGYPFRLLPLTAACGAFGGVCIIMQVSAIVSNRFSLKPFVLARLLSAPLSAGWCMVLYRFFGNFSIEASTKPEVIVNFNNFLPSVCLIMMIFLSLLKKGVAFSRQMCYNK